MKNKYEINQKKKYGVFDPFPESMAKRKRFINKALSKLGLMTISAARDSQANFHAQYQRWIADKFSKEIGGKMKPENEISADAVEYSNECFDAAKERGFFNVRYDNVDYGR